jgi:hypothetical protein
MRIGSAKWADNNRHVVIRCDCGWTIMHPTHREFVKCMACDRTEYLKDLIARHKEESARLLKQL